MSEQLKASVLAKCQNEWDSYDLEDYWQKPVWRNTGGWFDVRNEPRTVRLECKAEIPAGDEIWVFAAKILGIQEVKPKLVRDKDGLFPIVGGGLLADIFNACKAQLDAPYPSTDGCIDTIRRVLRWALEAIEQPEPARPSDALLWVAFERGRASVPHNLDEARQYFGAWLDRLPPDPLAADRELVLKYIDTIEYITEEKMVSDAIRRLCGKGVENG